MKKEWNKISLIAHGAMIALGIFLMGYCISTAVKHFKDAERSVLVKGLAEKEVMADRVVWPIMHQAAANDLSEISALIAKANEKIIAFLYAKGLDSNEVSVSSMEIYDRRADRYSAEKGNGALRYAATAIIIVNSSKVNLVRKIMASQSDLLKQGVATTSGDYRTQIQYTFNGLNDIKPAMITEANMNARKAAESFAKDAESSLGKIKKASQGQFSINDRDMNTPYIKIVRVVTSMEYYLE